MKTRDLVHRYYQNQVQIDGGKNDKFVAASDAKGLSMGVYDTANLPLAEYAKRYTLADRFFQGAFRSLVPQPPVADRGKDTVLRRRGLRWRAVRHPLCAGCQPDAGGREGPAADHSGRRRLGREHDPADQPTVRGRDPTPGVAG